MTSSKPHSTVIDISREISNKNDLMALPSAVMEILESAARDEVGIDSLATSISHDPALTGRLLKIANSPFYGLSNNVNSIQQAVMVLGITTVKCLALSAALFNRQEMKYDIGLNISTLYGSIISVAVTSRKIAVSCKYSSPEDAFTCGLLHDIGLLYLLHHHPKEYQSVLLAAKSSGSLFDEERKLFRMAHDEVGKLIAEKWRLPDHFVSCIANHNSCGSRGAAKLDDIVRLAVALNRDVCFPTDQRLEDKVTRIDLISSRLGIENRQIDEIAMTSVIDSLAFARAADIQIESLETILARANRELFSTYMAIQNLFRERQELTRKILEEERERGILESKKVAISTLSHYINNASMAISGNCQVLKMLIETRNPGEVVAAMPKVLDIISQAVFKIAAVLEELSELNSLEGIEFFSKSKIIDFDVRIKSRMEKMKNDHGLVLPEEVSSSPGL